ncbi:hypothetical protein THAR02_04278 [Trichoderma harzianum]|uniref:Uncharacterized protein n=1 Tax=Trichoderma harzianum TaxID=5544 RepID=A0A0G0AEX8_TRIHA|nr:hypothetical protein THAR02_04278 [Trichoderma harzianum]
MNPDQPPDSSSMSVTTSPAQDVAKLMGRRSLSNIPKDQRTLLELENPWAVDQRDEPHGLATVPSHVLKTLKEAFIRLKDDNEKENPKGKENPDPPPATNDHDGQNGYSPGSTPARSDSAPPSSPGVPIPWSQSQVKSRAQQDDEMSDAGSPIDETPSSPVPAPLTQPPLFHGTPSPSPSSSDSEPEDLEMELPQAQENREVPINREAPINPVVTRMHLTVASQEPASLVTSMVTTTNTPTCAQPRVASTACTSSEDPKSSVLPVDPAHGRSRRMKPIEFSEDSPKVTVRSTNPGPPTRMPSTRVFPEENVPNSASLSSSNSAPYHGGRPQSSPSPPPPTPPPHNFPVKHTTPQNRTAGQHTIPQNRTNGQRDGVSSRDISPHRQAPMQQLYRIQAAGMNAFISYHAEPYSAFTVTYPDYITVHSGNLLSFIQACVYLEMLQEDRAIREYLYDDFIRAWSSGFLTYVQNAGPGQEPLPAVQWFNMLKGPILFNRMCINSGNIGAVLNAYPEDAARVRAILHASKEASESPISEPQPEQRVEMELEEEPEPEPEFERVPEPEHRHQRKRRVVDLDSDNAMDITVTEESRAEPQLPPPTRKPPSLPAPSRPAPPPPPRPLSPELGSDDFDFPPLPVVLLQSTSGQQSRSRSRPHTHEPQPQSRRRPEPQPETRPEPQPQPQLQPHRELTLPQRQSPRRHQPAPVPIPPVPIPPIPVPSSTAPASLTTKRTKSTNPKSSPRSTDHAGKLVPRGRSVPSSGSRAIPKLRKRSTEERARLKEHFRKMASSSSTSFLGGGVEN